MGCREMEVLQSAISIRHITPYVVFEKAGSSYPNEEGHTNKWRQASQNLPSNKSRPCTVYTVYDDSSDLFAAFLPFHNGHKK